MRIKELRETLEEAIFKAEHADAAGRNAATERARLRNILLDLSPDILAALKEAEGMAEEITALDNALEKSDNELRELREQKAPKKKDNPKG